MMKGFTLIELLVVFTIIGILTSVGIASYSSYNTNQSMQLAVSDLENVLNTAKSRAISQVKPTQCGGQTLVGYQVHLAPTGTQYTLQAVCGNQNYDIDTRDLPTNITFAAGSTTDTLFIVSTGNLAAPATLTLSGNGKTRIIIIQTSGTIMVQ